MTTAYNFTSKLYRARQAEKTELPDPGADGTVIVYPYDLNVLKIDTTGARTLQAATVLPVGTQVLVSVTAAGVTVNGTALADGETALFVVSRNSSAVNEWIILA